MRVLIVHNPSAGTENRAGQAIVRAFERAGHEVRYRSSAGSSWKKALATGQDVIVAAGGDGTVEAVMRELAERSTRVRATPIAILPLGTANNVAQSLGIRTSATQLAAGLEHATPTPFALARARGRAERRIVVESAGIGVFADLFDAAARRERKATAARRAPPRAWSVAQARARLARLIARAAPKLVRVRADGDDLSGEYLLAEALNVACIGPRVHLAPGDVTDGALDLILVGEADRDGLLATLAASEDCARSTSRLRPHRARRVEFEWPAHGGHVDDELWSPPRIAGGRNRTQRVTVEVERPLTVWIPRRGQ